MSGYPAREELSLSLILGYISIRGHMKSKNHKFFTKPDWKKPLYKDPILYWTVVVGLSTLSPTSGRSVESIRFDWQHHGTGAGLGDIAGTFVLVYLLGIAIPMWLRSKRTIDLATSGGVNCSKCGSQTQALSEFCQKCGTKLSE